MQPFVSVIVPVYKVEDCLERCLDSLRRQSLTEIEILLIDDASPDRCGEICDIYSSKDKRFRVFHHTENLGLSEARNAGIRQALCEYVMFVDGDDYVHEDFCKIAYECAVHYHSDLVMFRRQRCDSGGSLLEAANQLVCTESEGYKTQREALDLIHGEVGMAAWNKLYRKELFQVISYPVGYYYEDLGTTYKLILQASSIYFVDKVLYFWCYRESSITTLRTKKAFQDCYIMNCQHYRDMTRCGYYTAEEENTLLLKISLHYCILQKRDDRDSIYAFCAEKLRESSAIPRGFTWKQKVLIFLFRYCPLLFETICSLSEKCR